ncbi:glycosyltransferase family 4 protein [Kytococcus aerolatus]|uniref:glycosyltransferase family 4 protein n=1 Tax=Kytococcus aerolatus TaxID=592308 RepID=UPI000B58AC31|nr:glycosyltransferase family 1 protein [Kytococcus aerolatus]
MRVAIVTESFLPALNGVTTSVCKVLECLADKGHEAAVVCPRSSTLSPEDQVPTTYAGFPVHPVASVPVRGHRVGMPGYDTEAVFRGFKPDVAHIASPFVLGVRGLSVARQLRIPTVAIYQTDMPSYIRQHAGPAGYIAANAAWRWIRRIHAQADLTLAPSQSALDELREHDIPRTDLWGRGVDAKLFHPDRKATDAVRRMRSELAPNGEVLLGYVGRLAPEKELHRFLELADLPGTRMVFVGDGPSRELLAHQFPDGVFLGRREGDELADAYAAFDLFLHAGTRETFGQTLQEAAASGLPVIAPRRGGPIDLVDHGGTGYLFDPDRPGSLREEVEKLVLPPDAADERERMAVAGRAKVEGRSWSAMVDRLLEYYEQVVPLHRDSRRVV